MEGTDLVERFQTAQEAVANADQERNLVAAREETFKEQLEAYKARLKEEGVDPAKIDDEIEKIEAEIDSHLSDLEEKLSGKQAQTTPEAPESPEG